MLLMAIPIVQWQANEGHALKPNAEPCFTGQFVGDGGNSTVVAERHESAYADRHWPLKFVEERCTRGRACKKSRSEGSKDGDGDREEDEEEEEEDSYIDSDSDSDFSDGGRGTSKLGPTQPTLPNGHFTLDRDHHSFNHESSGSDDEQLELVIGEPVDGVRAVSGFSKTDHSGVCTLKGLVTPEGFLYLYKAEDVVDAAKGSVSADRREKGNTAADRRAKMTKPRNMYFLSVPKDTAFSTAPQHLSGPNSTQYWTFAKAIRELFTNCVDQARVTAKEEFPTNTPATEHCITRKGGCIAITYSAEDVKLAEITFQKKNVKWTRSFVKPSTKYEPSHVVGPSSTWVLTFKNFGALIKLVCFLRGVSGSEKEGNPDVSGKFGDGLKSAIDTVVRRGINVTAMRAGYTTIGILGEDGQSYIQHQRNSQTERSVTITLTFMPELPELSEYYRRHYTEHYRDPICPETFDPTSMYLPGSADRICVNKHGAILLDENMRGKYYNRDSPVYDNGEAGLFGYSLTDPDRELIQGRDRGAMDPKLTRSAVDKLLCAGIEKSSRLRRKLVMKLTREYVYGYDDIRPQKWTARAVELLQQESRIMFQGTVLLSGHPSHLCTIIAGFRQLEIVRIRHDALDEGTTLVDNFVEELRSLPREEIDGRDSASGWASTVREDLLRLTGATSFASVEFPGKMETQQIVWVEKDVVLVSRWSLNVDLKKEGFKTAMPLYDVISGSMSRFDKQPSLWRDICHLITSAEHRPQESPSALVNGASDASDGSLPGDWGSPVPPASEEETAGPEVAPNGAVAPSAAAPPNAVERTHPEATAEESGPAGDGESAAPGVASNGTLAAPAAAPAIAEEQASPEVLAECSGLTGDGESEAPEVVPIGVLSAPTAAEPTVAEQAYQEAAAEESGDESDGIDGERMEEEQQQQQDSGGRSLCGGKRAGDTVEAEAAAKRNKASDAEGGGSASGVTPPVLAQVATVAAKVAGMPTVSVKVEESAPPEGGASTSVEVEELRSPAEAAATLSAPVQPGRSDEVMFFEGLEVSQEEKAAEVYPSAQPPPPAPDRNGEELGAFLSEGEIVPALIHVERRAMGGESVDLYRIAGRKDNEAELSARFSAVVASERTRRVLESATKKPGVDISLFCWDEPDALAAFVGQDPERIFLNLHHGSKSVDEWGVDDLPTHIASAVAHVRSATAANVRSHAWSVEFRKWVMSEEL
eukprot:g9604.t1